MRQSLLGVMGLGMVVVACGGFKEPTYVSYAPPQSAAQQPTASPLPTAVPTGTGTPTPLDPAKCAADARAAFNLNVAPAVEGKCSACHASTVPNLKLEAGKAEPNYTAMKKIYATVEAKIYGTSHGGNEQSANLPKAKAQLWTAAEAKCK